MPIKQPEDIELTVDLINAVRDLYIALEVAYPYVHADLSPKAKADASVVRDALAKARGQL